jgi:hypothetical protein
MAVRPEIAPHGEASHRTSGCEDSAAVDDWRSVRLRVGTIGRPGARD